MVERFQAMLKGILLRSSFNDAAARLIDSSTILL
jgi:hypothetical protein